MSYRVLYDHRQALPFHLKRTHLLKLAQEVSGKEAQLLCTGKLSPEIVRGLYVSVDDPKHLAPMFAKNKNLIWVARGLNRCWTRMVVFKEAMHLFDTPEVFTNTTGDFKSLIEEFITGKPQPSMAMASEHRAFWMGLSLFLPEGDRAALAQKRASKEMSDDEIADLVKIPLLHVPSLFAPDYKSILDYILSRNES